MATKKTTEQDSSTSQPGETERSLPAADTFSAQDELLADQMAELKDLVLSLKNTVQETQARATQNAMFKTTMDEIKQVANTIPLAGYSAVAQPTPGKQESGDCDCGCTDSGCCCFEIVLDRVRAIQPQGILEPADMGDTALPLPTINELEVRIFASIDNIGILIPSLSTTLGLRVPSLISGGGPGLWMPINQVIGRVFVKRGVLENVLVEFQGSEIDEGAERPIAFKDEHGFASGSITLDCCMSRIYPPIPTDLSFNFGGTGGGNPGAISLAFYARRVCC